jgi:hypothetical protein
LVSNEDDEKKEETLFDLVKRRYDSEWERLKGLDDKAGNLIGYVSIVTGLLLGLGIFEIVDKLTKPVYYLSYFGGIILLLSSIILSMIAIKVREWSIAPKIDTVQSMLKDEDYNNGTVLREGIEQMGNIVKENEDAINKKANWVELSWYCLIGGLIGIFLFVIFLSTGL